MSFDPGFDPYKALRAMAGLHSYLDNDNPEATMNGLEESKELEDSNPRGNLIVRHFHARFCDLWG